MKTWEQHIELAEAALEKAVIAGTVEYMDSLVNMADTHKDIAQVVLYGIQEDLVPLDEEDMDEEELDVEPYRQRGYRG